MYSLALLIFDCDLKEKESVAVLGHINQIVQEAFFKRNGSTFNEAQKSQFGVYFELIGAISSGPEVMGNCTNRGEKTAASLMPYAPVLQPVSSSRLHVRVSEGLLKKLNEGSGGKSAAYRIVDEFCGFESGTFPVDCAVYHNDVLECFLEIDGDLHYKLLVGGEQVLRRADELKEFLYRKRYPNVPFIRKKNPHHVTDYSIASLCEDLANEINS
jgi:hypothetical protein